MEFKRTYTLENKSINEILDDMQEFINIIDNFKNNGKNYKYNIKVLKSSDRLFNGIIKVENEK
jgi:hypothetical protein